MKPNRLFLLIAALVATTALAACSPFAPGQRNPVPDGLPQQYSEEPQGGEALGQWWRHFGSEELDGLVERALSRGFTLRQYWAKLEQAQAQARQAGADLIPTLNATGDAGHTRAWTKTPSSGGKSLTLTDSYGLGLAASYELDLWGRIRAEAEAGILDAEASREDLNTAAMTVAGSVSEDWVDLAATREQIRLVKDQIKTNEQILAVQMMLFNASQATALDVLQQREALATAKALLPSLETQERTLLNELAILTGQAPGTLELTSSAMPELPAPPAAGLPAALIQARPDIRSAALTLESADWDVTAAKADRLPSLTLSATGEYGGSTLKNLFDAWTLNLGSSLVFPLIDGGTRAAEVDRTRAAAEEQLAVYEEAVFTALQEVEDALVTESGQNRYLSALDEQLVATRQTLAEAKRRYLNGVDDYLAMLSALTSVQSLERTLVQQKAELLKNRIALYRALGGDWTADLTPTGIKPSDISRKSSS